MLVGPVIWNEVENDFEIARMGCFQQAVEVSERAKQRMHGAIVGHVVAEILHRRRIDRRNPYAVDTEPAQVVQARNDSLQITHPVVCAGQEGTSRVLVDHAALPPHVCAISARRCLVQWIDWHTRRGQSESVPELGASTMAAWPGMRQPSSSSISTTPPPPYLSSSLDQ